MAGVSVPTAIAEAIRQNILGDPPSISWNIGEPQPLGLFYDLDSFESGLRNVKEVFGSGFLHAMAIKSNSVSSILKIVKKEGLGVECASIGEVLHCLDIGFDAAKIVYDSPTKTTAEIRFALEKGIHLNADNFQELEIIAHELKHIDRPSESTIIGLRVNPIIGLGDITELSCSLQSSKFGVPMTEEIKKQIIEYFKNNSWLNSIHVHIGSQSYDAKRLAVGIRKAVLLALEINKTVGKKQVIVFDIGGGLPVNRKDDTAKPTFYEYAEELKKMIPEFFDGTFKQVVTEFGQALNAKSGWLASRVEYVKKPGIEDSRIVLIHIGADLCMRTCYCPDQKKYQRRIHVFDKNGQPKQGIEKIHTIAGPLCFSGDVLKRDVVLPEVERGDYLVLLDCGANSLSLSCRHCSRFTPSVYGYRVLGNGEVNFFILKETETKEEMFKFWGGGKESPYLEHNKENNK